MERPVGAAAAAYLAYGPSEKFGTFMDSLQANASAPIPEPPVQALLAMAREQEAETQEAAIRRLPPDKRMPVRVMLAMLGTRASGPPA